MNHSTRLAALGSAAVLSLAAYLGVAALRGPRPAVAARTCEATWSVSLGAEARELPHSLAARRGEVWAAVVREGEGAQVRIVRARDGRLHQQVLTARADRPDALSPWLTGHDALRLVAATAGEARVITPGEADRVIPLPRRDRAPALAAALAANGDVTLLARWEGTPGARIIPGDDADWLAASGAPEALARTATRITLDAITLPDGGAVLAATLSSAPAGEGCAPGAWASLRGATGTATARALVPESEARCGDAVRGVSWRGAKIAAVIETAAGIRLAMGDVSTGAPTRVALEPAGTRVLAASAVHVDGAVLALWTTPGRDAIALRYRLFDDNGAPQGEPGALGELLASPEGARATAMAATATGPREAAMALATSHGSRMFQVRCGADR